ncbi:MAG: His-Xaa-Ser repeat protein HxsA [Novosphingobium sp.]|nr:His-Xaa-Ser repeat protein HxsA [Novosphingobium sp.]
MIASLATAGVLPIPASEQRALAQSVSHDGSADSPEAAIERFAAQHYFQLAQHRSHASHSSHSSHRSSSSGSSRTRSYPTVTPPPPPPPAPRARNTRSTPPSSVLPSSPAVAPNSLFGGSVEDPFTETIKKVQRALIAYGYYNGIDDGIVGKNTRSALVRFQTDYNLKVTGTVTPEVLNAFGISAP